MNLARLNGIQTDLNVLVQREPFDFRSPSIMIGDISISIQRGEYNYSTPRIDWQDSSIYSAFEVGLFDFRHLPDKTLWPEHEDSGDLYVYAYVDRALIEAYLYELNIKYIKGEIK